MESYTHLTSLEDKVKTSEEQVQSLDEQIKELNEKLSAAQSEVTTKEDLVKKHAAVAEEAVSGIIHYPNLFFFKDEIVKQDSDCDHH